MSASGAGPIDDAALMAAIAGGSDDAVAALYDRFVEVIYAGAYRLLGDAQGAEEVVQETILTAWNRAEQFDPRLGSLTAWLLSIARNRAIDRLRAAGRRPRMVPIASAAGEDETDSGALERLAMRSQATTAAPARSPEEELSALELQATVRGALASIPEQERAVIVLAYGEQLSQSEIAERLGWPLGTVKTRTRRALQRLRDMLADELGPEAPALGAGLSAADSGSGR